MATKQRIEKQRALLKDKLSQFGSFVSQVRISKPAEKDYFNVSFLHSSSGKISGKSEIKPKGDMKTEVDNFIDNLIKPANKEGKIKKQNESLKKLDKGATKPSQKDKEPIKKKSINPKAKYSFFEDISSFITDIFVLLAVIFSAFISFVFLFVHFVLKVICFVFFCRSKKE